MKDIGGGLKIGGVYVFVLGKMRKVTTENGKKWVTYKNKKMTITEARKLQKEMMAKANRK